MDSTTQCYYYFDSFVKLMDTYRRDTGLRLSALPIGYTGCYAIGYTY